MCGGDQLVAFVGVDAHHQSALPARSDRHVAGNEEREAAKHLLLREVGLLSHEVADALRELLVVSHHCSVENQEHVPRRDGIGTYALSARRVWRGQVPRTVTGVDELVLVPSPSSPSTLDPQHLIVPPTSTAH